jgi:hypothetical protein
MINIHAVSGIRTHDLNDQTVKAYASNRAGTGTDIVSNLLKKIRKLILTRQLQMLTLQNLNIMNHPY